LTGVVLDDGQIVVNDLTSLKYFDENGRFIRRVGQAGARPGEFSQIGKICGLAGDSVLAFNYPNGNISLWDPAGRLVREVSGIRELASQPCFRDGTIILRLPLGSGRNRKSAPAGNQYVRVRLPDRRIASLGTLPPDDYGPIIREAQVIAAGGRVYVAEGLNYEIRIKTINGQIAWILRVDSQAKPIDDAAWSRLVDASLPRNLTPQRRQSQRKLMNSRRPPAFPAYGSVEVDADGRIWVQDYEDKGSWMVFRPSGALLGRLVIPSRRGVQRTLVGVNGDTILVRALSSGPATPRVELYRLEPPN
jgi:hypothetical protein